MPISGHDLCTSDQAAESRNSGSNLRPLPFSRFGQFISSTLHTFAVCEKFVVMEINNEEKIDGGTVGQGFPKLGSEPQLA